MTTDEDGKHVILASTGRRFYAYGGHWLLSPIVDDDDYASTDALEYGHDGTCTFEDDPLTQEERDEIADTMVALWRRWQLRT